MHHAAFYQCANQMQRNDAEIITKEIQLHWRVDGQDSLLDIGSGSGDVLIDFIYPLLPKDFCTIVGTDISNKMVKHAQHYYVFDGRIKFRQLDIECEILPKDLINQFDHVTSFYCLHWVQNQRQALLNINKLLRYGGDCLLVFLVSTPLYDIYKTLSEDTKWAPYMKDVERFISPFHSSRDAVKDFNNILLDAGFVDCKVELRDRVNVFSNAKALENSVKAICPFTERLSIAEQEVFISELMKCAEQMEFQEYNAITLDYKFAIPYKLMVVHARKPSDYFSSVIGDCKINKGLN